MRQLYDIVEFDVYGELPEDRFFNPSTLQNIVDNDPVVQTIELCFLGNSTWCKMVYTDDNFYCDPDQSYTLNPCCRKATYLCRNAKGKLYLLVAKA